LGVAAEEGKMTYYMIDEGSTMNSFSKENLEALEMFDKVTEKIEIPVRKLSSILTEYREQAEVDYLNIDAEGYELEILGELTNSAIKPSVVSVEQNGPLTLSDVLASETEAFFSKLGYTPIAKNLILPRVSTVFYVRNDLIESFV
jgi:hypothetical protein